MLSLFVHAEPSVHIAPRKQKRSRKKDFEECNMWLTRARSPRRSGQRRSVLDSKEVPEIPLPMPGNERDQQAEKNNI